MAKRLGPKKGHELETMLHDQLLRWIARNHCIAEGDVPVKVWNVAWKTAIEKYYSGYKVETILSNIGLMIDREITK